MKHIIFARHSRFARHLSIGRCRRRPRWRQRRLGDPCPRYLKAQRNGRRPRATTAQPALLRC